MKDATVGARYARALHIVTEKRGETARALEDLQGMARVLGGDSRVGTLLSTPQVRLADKRKALTAVLNGKVVKSVELFVDLLLRKKRINGFDEIVREFQAIVERQQGVQRAHVTSAVPLAANELDRLHAELEKRTQSKIKLTSDVDASLLGGALVRIGDRVIDRSVRTLLEQMERQLSEVSV